MSGRQRIPVAVLGATGSVGQRFIELLVDHPWFVIKVLTASERSRGKSYREAAEWISPQPLPPGIGEMEIRANRPASVEGCPIVFSALDTAAATATEHLFAAAGHMVVSNASSHRMDVDVPLIVPEINPDHLDLAAAQHFGKGVILTNPNCSTIGLVLALCPLHRAFGIDQVRVVTLQALSGAGLPGVSSMRMIDNLIPYIPNEEDKLGSETRKILGRLDGHRIEPAEVTVSASCNRVPVLDGHTLCVSLSLRRTATAAEIRRVWEEFRGRPQELELPSAPRRPLHVFDEVDAPQPRLHRDRDGGMAVSLGRLRPCEVLEHQFVALVHNTLRGAAKGAVLVAELAVEKGMVS